MVVGRKVVQDLQTASQIRRKPLEESPQCCADMCCQTYTHTHTHTQAARVVARAKLNTHCRLVNPPPRAPWTPAAAAESTGRNMFHNPSRFALPVEEQRHCAYFFTIVLLLLCTRHHHCHHTTSSSFTTATSIIDKAITSTKGKDNNVSPAGDHSTTDTCNWK